MADLTMRDAGRAPGDASRTIDTSTLADRVLAAVERSLLAGELRPGDRVVETVVAQRLGTSRGPVREAIRHLTAEGLLESTPHKGATVRRWSAGEVRDVYATRAVLEGYAAGLAAAALAPAGRDELAAIVGRLEEAHAREDAPAVVELDVSFHQAVYRMSGNVELLRTLDALIRRTRMILVYDASEDLRHDESVLSHRFLLSALVAGDPREAERAFREHLTEAGGIHAARMQAREAAARGRP